MSTTGKPERATRDRVIALFGNELGCYAQGVKANVLFLDRRPASPDPWTRKLWVYDLAG